MAEDFNLHLIELGDADGGEMLTKMREHVANALNASTGMAYMGP